jgi:arabinofuranosyltransferase
VTSARTRNTVFLLILLGYLVYAGIYIFRTSFVHDGQRYFCLFDDAMISMRFARNLAQGFGLVWNPGGERVEGFTNPLWVLYMALFHLLPISAAKTSLCIQVSAALLMAGVLFLVKRIAELISDGSLWVSAGSVLLTAFYLPITTWTLHGMEVSALMLALCLALWQALHSLRDRRFSPWPYLWLGLGTLIRPDAVILLMALTLYLFIADHPNRRAHVAAGLAALIVFAGLQTAFRWLYYGDILPNTYYLKMTRYPILLRWCAGASGFYQMVFRMNWILIVFPLVAVWVWRRRDEVLLFWVFAAQSAYEIYVGGGAWRWGVLASRYACTVMPLFFILFAITAERFLSWVVEAAEGRSLAGWTSAIKGALLIACLFSFNGIAGPEAFAEWLLVTPPFEAGGNNRRVDFALHLKQITKPGATIAVVYGGAIPYFADRRMIDLLGKSDRRIARETMRQIEGLWKYIYFYPGHLKWDYAYSIGELKPDVVAQLWWKPEEAEPYLRADYTSRIFGGFTYYVRNGSPNVQ